MVRFSPGEYSYLSYYGWGSSACRGDTPRNRVEAFPVKYWWDFFVFSQKY